MGKLDEILDNSAPKDMEELVNTSSAEWFELHQKAKQQIKSLMLELVDSATVERRFDPISGVNIDLVSKTELKEKLEAL